MLSLFWHLLGFIGTDYKVLICFLYSLCYPQLVNSTRLLNLLFTEPNVTNRHSAADCVALLFYARYCPFSSMAAPHFNALARAFPDIKMAAVDAMKHHR
jgi:thiol-disulfide isomerase/thioredoxin